MQAATGTNRGADTPLCCKCKAPGIATYSRSNPYCKECFVYHFESKVRQELNSKWIPPNSRALLLLSGGASSRALLHLVHMFQDSRLKIQDMLRIKFSKIYVGHIDESISALSEPLSLSALDFLKDICKVYGLELVVKPLEDFFEGSLSPRAELLRAVSEVIQDTRRDMILSYRASCIRALIEQLSCNILISGESSEKRAVDVLLHISKGRGVLVSPENEFPTLRPMSHVTNQEIAFYNTLMGLRSIPNSPGSENTMEGSISKLIRELTPDFPMTSSTVVSIANKISIPREKISGRCEKCMGPREVHAEEWLASKSLPGVQHSSGLCYACIRLKSYLQGSRERLS